MLSKSLYRGVRYNPVTERLQLALRKERAVSFPEIDLVIPISRDDIVIDAGANVGDITSRCARTGATVHAFEPHPACYAILKKRFAAVQKVHVHNAGVMDRECTLALSAPTPDKQYDGLETSVAASFLVSHDGPKMEVTCIDLAAFIKGLSKPVALLKMDIEGAEVPVINHLLDTGVIERVKMAVVETHERLSQELADSTEKLRQRITDRGLNNRIRLDWI